MYSIAVCFRAARSKVNKEKQGVVFYKIKGERTDNGKERHSKSFNSDINGKDSSVLITERKKIADQLRIIYCIIEQMENSGKTYHIDAIAKEFKKAIQQQSPKSQLTEKTATGFSMRTDLVSICREFKNEFEFISPEKRVDKSGNLLRYIHTQSELLKSQHKISRARAFLSTCVSLSDFVHGCQLEFRDITHYFIGSYSTWLKNSGIAESTQHFYLRTLRAILSLAHKDGLICYEKKWFLENNPGINHYKATKETRVLDNRLLANIRKTIFDEPDLNVARDMFMFGFYCRGMELVDIINLTYNNIIKDKLVYRRRLKGQLRQVILGEPALQIIKKYQTRVSRYIFPVLDKDKNILYESIRNKVYQNIRTVGKKIGYPYLTFNMNISSWENLISQNDISSMLVQ